MVPLINGLSDIADHYDHFILDIYGVLHDGIRPFALTIETLEKLKRAGKQTCLLSNSPRRVENVIQALKSMGITRAHYDHILTSGEATYQALKNRDADLGDACWFIGNAWGSEILEGQNLKILNGPENASFLLNSIPGTEGTARDKLMKQLRTAANKDLPMLCANPDLVVNIGTELYECAGTFAALYEQMGGRVIYFGKPHKPVYETCFEYLGKPEKSRICAVGDSFHTDITGANRFRIDSVINLIGIHWEEVVTAGKADPAKLEALLESQNTQPIYMMAGLSW
jgi:HAD superfamily hydrolase (TIGR01459 family)